MTRSLASLMLVLLGSSRAMAQIAPPYSFLPPNPSSLDDIQLRIETPSTCSSFAGESDVDLPTNTITVRFAFDDTCDPNSPQDNAPFRFVGIGRLPAGHYAVTVESCTDAPPPAPECQMAARETSSSAACPPPAIPFLRFPKSATHR